MLAAVQVGRTGGWTSMGLDAVSGLAGIASRMASKRRAAGLPQLFLLAVTEERIYALALPKMSSGRAPRAVRELARWERAAVTVAAAPVMLGTKIVIESPAEGERVECQGPDGELSDRVLRALSAVPAVA